MDEQGGKIMVDSKSYIGHLVEVKNDDKLIIVPSYKIYSKTSYSSTIGSIILYFLS